jgi:hypothetical protein
VFRVNFGIRSNRAIFHPTEDIHGYLAYALFALAGIHAIAALCHHFTRHDDKGHDTDDRYDKHKNVEQPVHGTRQAAREFANLRRQGGRRVPTTPREPCNDQYPNE